MPQLELQLQLQLHLQLAAVAAVPTARRRVSKLERASIDTLHLRPRWAWQVRATSLCRTVRGSTRAPGGFSHFDRVGATRALCVAMVTLRACRGRAIRFVW